MVVAGLVQVDVEGDRAVEAAGVAELEAERVVTELQLRLEAQAAVGAGLPDLSTRLQRDPDAGCRQPASEVEHMRGDGRAVHERLARMLRVTAGAFTFMARLEEAAAPRSVAAFRTLLPLRSRLIQARWSGEAAWIPFGELDVGVGFENATSYPAPGHLLLYPGGFSETEILFPYGSTCFASKMGQLAGNHFATITQGLEQLPELGRQVLWEGAQNVEFEES